MPKKRGHGSQWISYKINIRHPLQLKKSKSWEPFRSYQLNSTANPAHLPQIGPNGKWCLAGSSYRAPRILIFSIAMGANHSFYVKTIETHTRTFLTLNILAIGWVPVPVPALFWNNVINISQDKLSWNLLFLQAIFIVHTH